MRLVNLVCLTLVHKQVLGGRMLLGCVGTELKAYATYALPQPPSQYVGSSIWHPHELMLVESSVQSNMMLYI
jgi:hypothetical protein